MWEGFLRDNYQYDGSHYPGLDLAFYECNIDHFLLRFPPLQLPIYFMQIVDSSLRIKNFQCMTLRLFMLLPVCATFFCVHIFSSRCSDIFLLCAACNYIFHVRMSAAAVNETTRDREAVCTRRHCLRRRHSQYRPHCIMHVVALPLFAATFFLTDSVRASRYAGSCVVLTLCSIVLHRFEWPEFAHRFWWFLDVVAMYLHGALLDEPCHIPSMLFGAIHLAYALYVCVSRVRVTSDKTTDTFFALSLLGSIVIESAHRPHFLRRYVVGALPFILGGLVFIHSREMPWHKLSWWKKHDDMHAVVLAFQFFATAVFHAWPSV